MGSMLFTFFVGAEMGASGRLCQGWLARNCKSGAWRQGRMDVVMAAALFFFGYRALGKVGKIRNEARVLCQVKLHINFI